MKMRGNKCFVTGIILFWSFFVLTLADLVFTFFVNRVHLGHNLESNPIFLVSGSFWLLVLINFCVIFFIWYVIFSRKGMRSRPDFAFFITAVIVYNCFLRFLALKSAFIILFTKSNAEVMAVSAAVTNQMLLKEYVWLVIFNYLFPLFLIVIVYIIFRLSFSVSPRFEETIDKVTDCSKNSKND